MQEGYTDHLIFEDPETSSALPIKKRPGLVTMLDEIKKKDVGVIARLDRLSRDIIEMVQICREIRKKGANFFSLAEGCVEDWMLGIWGSVAQKEREAIGEKTRNAMLAMKRNNERVGHIPFGYCLVEDIRRTKENKDQKIYLQENPKEILVLKEMNKLRHLGKTYREMAYHLNKEELFNRDGKPWNHVSVSRVYKGFLARHQKN
jgi:DNA invertase Pin-like site-specific DNA recombinase